MKEKKQISNFKTQNETVRNNSKVKFEKDFWKTNLWTQKIYVSFMISHEISRYLARYHVISRDITLSHEISRYLTRFHVISSFFLVQNLVISEQHHVLSVLRLTVKKYVNNKNWCFFTISRAISCYLARFQVISRDFTLSREISWYSHEISCYFIIFNLKTKS